MTQAVAVAQGGSNNVTMRNRIINGAMMIDQRNAGNSVTPAADGYTVDRFLLACSNYGSFTIQRNAGSLTGTNLPSGFQYYLGITSTGVSSTGTSSYAQLIQSVEGLNTQDLMWGTANAQPVTLSFWVRSSLTGTFGGSLRNRADNRAYIFSYTINSANTWEQKVITVAGDTSGTWDIGNTTGISVRFAFSMGSTLTGSAGSWTAGGTFAPTGQVNVLGTNGATFYITGVQLEAGTTATPFEQRLYGTELALCERYGQQVAFNIYIGNGSGFYWSTAINFNSMRTAPAFGSLSGGSTGNITAEVVENITAQGCRYTILASSTNAFGTGRTAFASAEL